MTPPKPHAFTTKRLESCTECLEMYNESSEIIRNFDVALMHVLLSIVVNVILTNLMDSNTVSATQIATEVTGSLNGLLDHGQVQSVLLHQWIQYGHLVNLARPEGGLAAAPTFSMFHAHLFYQYGDSLHLAEYITNQGIRSPWLMGALAALDTPEGRRLIDLITRFRR